MTALRRNISFIVSPFDYVISIMFELRLTTDQLLPNNVMHYIIPNFILSTFSFEINSSQSIYPPWYALSPQSGCISNPLLPCKTR